MKIVKGTPTIGNRRNALLVNENNIVCEHIGGNKRQVGNRIRKLRKAGWL